MEFVDGVGFKEWLSWPAQRKLAALRRPLIRLIVGAVAVAILATVIALLDTYGRPKYRDWSNTRKIDSLIGYQVQRQVDPWTTPGEPYRYLFDKCLSRWTIATPGGPTDLVCRGNVRVLSGNDTLLGRADVRIHLDQFGDEVFLGIFFGEWRESFTRQELQKQ